MLKKIATILAALTISAASGNSAPANFVTHQFPAIGTGISVTYKGPKDAEIDSGIEAIFKELDAQASLYRPESRLSVLNQSPANEKVAIGPMLCRLLREGIRITKESEGRFDITYKNPAIDSVQVHCPTEGRDGTATLTKAGIFVDLNGIAAGFAADEVAAFLRSKGKTDFLIDAGGEILTCGKKEGAPWKVGVEDPANKNKLLKEFSFPDGKCHTLSTSGDYSRYIVKDGKKLSYIVDPKTGKSVEDAHLVTVLAGDGATADSLSTGLSVGLKDPAYIKRMKAKFKIRVFGLQGKATKLKEF